MSSATGSNPAPFQEAGRVIQRAFARVAFTLRPDVPVHHPVPSDLDVEDIEIERQRFELWAANLGLYNLGDRSLGYRLQEFRPLKEYILDLLQELTTDLSNVNGLITGRLSPLPWGASSDGSESGEINGETSSHGSSEVPKAEADKNAARSENDCQMDEEPQAPTRSDARIIFDDIIDIIDRLYKLAAKVRFMNNRSAPSSRIFYRDHYQEPGRTKIHPTQEKREQTEFQNEEFRTRRSEESFRQRRRDEQMEALAGGPHLLIGVDIGMSCEYKRQLLPVSPSSISSIH